MNRRSVLSSLGATGLCWLSMPVTGWAAISSKDATSALRTALLKGADVAVSQLGSTNGFLNSEKYRIGLPAPLDKGEALLRAMGRGKQITQLTDAMNHAAEQAVALAKPLLTDAIQTMSVQDALGILQGGDTAITSYFERKTRAPLLEKFQPVVNGNLEKLSATHYYNDLASRASKLGLLKGQSVTVQEHVSNKAMDGLFAVIGEEERRLRADPVSAGSALLKKVFEAL